jgi:DNA-directed RNA polymerase subunit RPC12/RpoP
VDPECPNCGHRVELVKAKKKGVPWRESITSELVDA